MHHNCIGMCIYLHKYTTYSVKKHNEESYIMRKFIQLLRTWKLPVAMIIGVILYYLFDALLPSGDATTELYYVISHMVQPVLIFTMLFLSFLKVDPRDLKPHRWHGVLLLTQGSLFVLCSLAALACDGSWGMVQDGLLADGSATDGISTHIKLLCEGAMLCFICPTATASAVIVQKLGGSLSGDVTYIVLCNLMVSLLAPGFLTLVEPHSGMDFLTEFFMIMGKVFPLLLCPLFVAIIVQHYAPRLKERLLSITDLAFYLWLVALALAITVTVKSIVESDIAIGILIGFAVISAVSCVMQFYLGRKIGKRWMQPTKAPSQWKSKTYIPQDYVDPIERSAITAGQAFGQKNTVFIIWMGLVFLNPVTSVVGGFYSIWHNVINSWQLYKRNSQSKMHNA